VKSGPKIDKPWRFRDKIEDSRATTGANLLGGSRSIQWDRFQVKCPAMELAESLSRVLCARQLLGDAFYHRLFAQVPEVQQFFEGIDMQRQAMLVTMALTVIQQHHDHHYPVTQSYLKYLGSRHSARGIPIYFYSQWRDTMLDTLASFHGTEWNERLSDQWKSAIDLTINEMMSGYAEHYTV
jgi:hemoglobin-like flavoprotein